MNKYGIDCLYTQEIHYEGLGSTFYKEYHVTRFCRHSEEIRANVILPWSQWFSFAAKRIQRSGYTCHIDLWNYSSFSPLAISVNDLLLVGGEFYRKTNAFQNWLDDIMFQS